MRMPNNQEGREVKHKWRALITALALLWGALAVFGGVSSPGAQGKANLPADLQALVAEALKTNSEIKQMGEIKNASQETIRAFAFMGGLGGFFFGIWYYQKEKLAAKNLESQRHQVALQTLQELMVTLAHYIRNANQVIGGFSSRMMKHLHDPEVQQQLKMIRQASQEIEAVIASLESLSGVDHTKYIGAWKTRMIDLKQELEARLAAFESPKEIL